MLCVYLFLWVPAGVAVLASRSLSSVAHRGAAAVVELVVHAGGAALCAAAGWMLWVRNVSGVPFSVGALAVNACLTLQALHASALPRDVAPGLALPSALITVGHAAAWMIYLRRSRRARAWLEG